MRNKFISSFAGAAFSFAASGLAFAQVPPLAPVYNWTGFYVGGNIGASFGTFKTDFNAPATIVLNSFAGFLAGSTPFAGFDSLDTGGFVGGGQIGYNWQLSPIWVVGVEADFQGIDEKEGSTHTGNFPSVILTNGFSSSVASASTVLDYQTKIDWFGTVRLRAGYVWGNGDVMSYVTGGLAYGRVDLEGTSTFSGEIFAPGPVLASVTQAVGHSQVNTGWVVGSGTEGKLLIPGWTYIEALYMDLGTLDATGPGGSSTTSFAPQSLMVTAGPVTTHTRFTDTILRAGLNYQFH